MGLFSSRGENRAHHDTEGGEGQVAVTAEAAEANAPTQAGGCQMKSDEC